MVNEMSREESGKGVKADVDDLVIYNNSLLTGETYIFEPAATEKKLGFLFAVAECEDREGLGRELIDTVIQALQREYYRDQRRAILPGFEAALHQGNLMLHDLVEQGMREWMGCWHVAIGVLAGHTLHISTAGKGEVGLLRAGRVTWISVGLSHSPITNPLRTFSQVASGTVMSRDLIFFGSSFFSTIFRPGDLGRFTADQSAGVIATRMKQLYEDQRNKDPVAALVLTVVPDDVATRKELNQWGSQQPRAAVGPVPLQPRRPLAINQSALKKLLVLTGRLARVIYLKIRTKIWPRLKAGSIKGSQLALMASRKAGQNMQQLTRRSRPLGRPDKTNLILLPKISIESVQMGPKKAKSWLKAVVKKMPVSSRIFGVMAIILAIGLVASLVLLQRKRASDAEIQRASEWLHEARVKQEAAETALIYDNRDQARQLLTEAGELSGRVKESGLYGEQVNELGHDITGVYDRLAKISRTDQGSVEPVGSFGTTMAQQQPKRLFYLQGQLYTYNPATNVIVSLKPDGQAQIVSDKTQGIGFFGDGSVLTADKTLVLATEEPGVAVFDAKTNLLQKQDINLPGDEPAIKALATFGNRLYLLEGSTNNIYGYSKTLRGYDNGTAWITAAGFPQESITDLAIDGFIYTLHSNGQLRKLYKGEEEKEFKMEPVDPPISAEARLIHDEELQDIYIFDQLHQRVVVYDQTGQLLKQIYFGNELQVVDATVDPEEKNLYVLVGIEVKKIPLIDEP